MADLPTDLWTEILARLPAKSLMRLRCVCKSWCFLIDSSDFIVTHLQIYNDKHKYLIAVDHLESTIQSIDTFRKIDVLLKAPSYYIILRRCYGLFLLLGYLTNELVFYNHCIRKSLVIPPCPLICKGYTIVYQPGYAPSANDYKLLAFMYAKFPEFSIAVYSLNDHRWRIKDKSPLSDLNFQWLISITDRRGNTRAFNYKGAMYWLGSDLDKTRPPVLVSFDFDSEEFNFVELPDALKQTGLFKSVFVLGESIAVFSMSLERTCIWVLVKDGGEKSWRLWHTGDFKFKSSSVSYN